MEKILKELELIQMFAVRNSDEQGKSEIELQDEFYRLAQRIAQVRQNLYMYIEIDRISRKES